MSGKIGIDIDHKNILRLLKTYFNARLIAKPVDVKETKHGFHLRIPKRTSLWRHNEVRLMRSAIRSYTWSTVIFCRRSF